MLHWISPNLISKRSTTSPSDHNLNLILSRSCFPKHPAPWLMSCTGGPISKRDSDETHSNSHNPMSNASYSLLVSRQYNLQDQTPLWCAPLGSHTVAPMLGWMPPGSYHLRMPGWLWLSRQSGLSCRHTWLSAVRWSSLAGCCLGLVWQFHMCLLPADLN